MARKYINEVSAYMYDEPSSPKESYGHSDARGRGFLSMNDMSDERCKEYVRAQKPSNNMVNVNGKMIGSWNLEF